MKALFILLSAFLCFNGNKEEAIAFINQVNEKYTTATAFSADVTVQGFDDENELVFQQVCHIVRNQQHSINQTKNNQMITVGKYFIFVKEEEKKMVVRNAGPGNYHSMAFSPISAKEIPEGWDVSLEKQEQFWFYQVKSPTVTMRYKVDPQNMLVHMAEEYVNGRLNAKTIFENVRFNEEVTESIQLSDYLIDKDGDLKLADKYDNYQLLNETQQ